MMTKFLIGLLGAGVIATGGYAAASSVDSDPARTVSLPGATTSDDPTLGVTGGVEDVSGPCDEAEHASDARCTGGTATGADRDDDDDGADDRSGRGRGRGGDDGHDDDRGGDEDRSGSNSGKG